MCGVMHILDESFGMFAEARFEKQHKGFIHKGPSLTKIILRDSVVKIFSSWLFVSSW